MKYNIIIAILICVILFILYKYIQAKQIISDKKGEIKTSEALFNFILQHIKSYILVIDRNFIVEKTNYYAITDTGNYLIVSIPWIKVAATENFARLVPSDRQ